MIELLKDTLRSKGMALIQSKAVGKLMESEKFGTAIEIAMSIPIKVSNAVVSQKERIVTMFDLATRQDLDELKRVMSRMDGALKEIRRESSDLLTQIDEKEPPKTTIAS